MRIKFKYSISTFPYKGVNYVCIPKCGTTTILYHLLNKAKLDDVSIHSERYVKYINAEEANTNDLITFATIRHPFDRVLSMYKDSIKRGIGNINEGMSIDSFIRMVYNNPDDALNIHFKSMYYFLNPLKDVKLIRLETMHCDEWLKELLNTETFEKRNHSEENIELSESQQKRIAERYAKDFQYLRETNGN